MFIVPLPTHEVLPDMPSASNSDHDGRYLNLDGEGTNVTNGTFDMTTTGTVTATNIIAGESLIVNNNRTNQVGLTLKGTGVGSAARGGFIRMFGGSSSDPDAFIFFQQVNSRLVFSDATQIDEGDFGKAWINVNDGSASFAATNFTISSTGVGSMTSGTTIGNLTLADGSITDSSGAISFGNENLSTEGTLTVESTIFAKTTLEVNSGRAAQNSLKLWGYDPGSSADARGGSIVWDRRDSSGVAYTFINNDYQFVWKRTAQSSGTDEGVAHVDFDSGVASFASLTTIGSLRFADGSITDSTGAISFGNENLSTQGTLSVDTGSTTALLIEDNGTKDNTLVVDTVNGTVGIGTPASTIIGLSSVFTNTGTGSFFAVLGNLAISSNSANSTVQVGFRGSVSKTGTGDNTGELIGVHGRYIDAVGSGTASVDDVIVVKAEMNIQSFSAKTYGAIAGFRTDITLTTTSGTFSDIRGMDIPAFIHNIGAATVTDVYGIHLTEQTIGSNNWQLYSVGGASFIGGNGSGHGIYFGQTDGAERIVSDADGTLDLYAGTSVDIHNAASITGDLSMIAGSKITFRDSGVFLNSSTTGLMDLQADAFKFTVDGGGSIQFEFVSPNFTGVFLWSDDDDWFSFEDEIIMANDEKFLLRTVNTGIYSQAISFLDLFADGAVRIGDSSGGAPTNYTEISPTGDIVFVGSAGLVYGGISAVENAVETTIGSSGVKVQITIFDRNMPSNNITPDNAQNHILITKAGDYHIIVSATVNSIGGAGSVLELEVMKNNGVSRLGHLHADRTLGGGGTERGSISLSDIVALAAPVVATRTTYAFVDSNPDTITDSSNNFVADGFAVGQTLTIAGSTSNDGDYTIATVAIGTLTLIAADSLTAEAAGDTVTATGSETVELWIENETNAQNYVVEDVTLQAIQLGGT